MAKQIATKAVAMTTMMALALVLLTATTGVHAANAECCSTCIGKAASSIYDYDPLVFDQCSISGSKRVCCFCTNLGEPLYGDTISYAEDGTTPTAKTGTWIKFKWTDAVNVTYISLKDGQKKTTTPTISDTTATLKSGYFMICANSVGKVIFRGWGDNACRVVSVEKSVTVVQGESGATCEAEPPAPTTTTTPSSSSSSATGSGSADTGISDCNTSRATIKTVNGVKQCVCVSDWAGAPACDQMPTWKWLVTIGGGVAALLSILISVRAFMKSREKKRLDEENVSTPRLGSRKDDVEILQITPDRRSHEMPVVAAPYQGSSRDVTSAQPVPYGRENNRAQSNPRRNDEREFTL